MEPDDPSGRTEALAALPRVDDVMAAAPGLVQRAGREEVRDAVRQAIDEVRSRVLVGEMPSSGLVDVADRAAALLRRRLRVGPRRVVNASGVVVHTNLGRAPLHPDAVAAIAAAAGWCDLEFDLDSGRRGSRSAHIDQLLARAAEAPAAMVVNNCAAALVLVLTALAQGRQVPVSRGHLVEIGGSFRLPDIMRSSGAELLEVGTTNRTRATDFEQGDDVALLLTVHPSNFVQDGFVTQPTLAEVSGVARRRGVPHVHDAGSGLLRPAVLEALAAEPSLSEALQAGADLVVASGDKLLGGPQAGLIVGRADLVDACRRHPLARALRVDKLRLAALAATLVAHLSGAPSTVERLLADDEALPRRAAGLAEAVGARVEEGMTMIGGGSAPGEGVVSPVVVLSHPHPQQLAAQLRAADPPVVGRVERGALRLDLRTVEPADDGHVRAALQAALDVVGGARPR